MRPHIKPVIQCDFSVDTVHTASSSKAPQASVDVHAVKASMATKSPEACLQVSPVDEFEALKPADASTRALPTLVQFDGSLLGQTGINGGPIDLNDSAFKGSSVTEGERIGTWQKAPAAEIGSRATNSAVISSLPLLFAAPSVSSALPTILVIDDEYLYQDLIADILGDDYKVLVADGGIAGLRIAMDNAPHLILLDLMMPGIDGFQVFKSLKADRRTSEIPVIFITGEGDTRAETKGLRMGAVDYITKPMNPDVVRARVNTQVTFKLLRDKLVILAATDGLTGLANRSHFDGMLAYEYGRHLRSGKELSLIMLDLDQFKAFNDAYGHTGGDECLREVAKALTKTVSRSTDMVARYGGEEFIVLLPETSLAGAVILAERIRTCISDLVLPHKDSIGGHVTASLGVVSGKFSAGVSILDVLTQADIQLYAAKAGGRNRVAYRAIETFGLTN